MAVVLSAYTSIEFKAPNTASTNLVERLKLDGLYNFIRRIALLLQGFHGQRTAVASPVVETDRGGSLRAPEAVRTWIGA